VPNALPWVARHSRERRTKTSPVSAAFAAGLSLHHTYVKRLKSTAATNGIPNSPTLRPRWTASRTTATHE
jgi:hypothetical protein